MDVDVVSFTGSTEVGRLFLRYSSESNLKRVVLECGGKSPQVVMADAADLDLVADNVVLAGYANMGENCTCGSRLIVHRSVRDELLERIVAKTADWIVGDPQDPATRIGPMIEAPHLDKVLGYIETGREEGARVVVGGERAMPDSGGYFVEPTVFDGVDNSMTIAREEIFGPVISTIAFDSEDEGLAIANDTNYGLARRGLHQRPRHGDPCRAHVACRDGLGQRLLRGRHHDAVRRLQGVGLRRPRQGPRGVRPVHREEDGLDLGQGLRVRDRRSKSSVTRTSLSRADSAPQTSPGRPLSWRTAAPSLGIVTALKRSVDRSKRTMAFAPKSVSQTMSRSST